MSTDAELKLIAYPVGDTRTLDLIPAPTRRDWMDETAEKYANRCLPLLIANQSGWWITNKHNILMWWDGSSGTDAIRIKSRGFTHCPAVSHFGHGIVTWKMPWLFRTPAGWNLIAKGPTNQAKDGIQALEGVIEADWAPMTFTMNWKFTRANKTVHFGPGDPICMILPQRRNELESFSPEIHDLSEDPELEEKYRVWGLGRDEFHYGLQHDDPAVVEAGWQKDYFRGRSGPEDHQTKRRLRAFTGGEDE